MAKKAGNDKEVKEPEGQSSADPASVNGGSLANLLAAIAYFDALDPAARAKAPRFEDLSDEQRQVFVDQAKKYLAYLGRVGLTVQKFVPKKEVELDREKVVDRLTQVIEEFVRGLKSTKPNLFPYRELAYRITERIS